jgi:hypothetical protein
MGGGWLVAMVFLYQGLAPIFEMPAQAGYGDKWLS